MRNLQTFLNSAEVSTLVSPRDRGWVVSEEDKKVFAFAETCDAFQEGPPDSHPVECDCASGNSGCVY